MLSATPLVGSDPLVEGRLVALFHFKVEAPCLSISGCLDGKEPRLFVGLGFCDKGNEGVLKVMVKGVW